MVGLLSESIGFLSVGQAGPHDHPEPQSL